MADKFRIRLRFFGDLPFFVPRRRSEIERELSERTAVKDAIEACGVPHPEVDLVLVAGEPVGFDFVLQQECAIEVFPFDQRLTDFAEQRLQVRHSDRFVGDGHLGTLARNLRLLGFDTAYDRSATDPQLVALASTENRAMLTRDRRLLMHRTIQTGYSPRSTNGLEQTIEVCRRFGLAGALQPFTRCLNCNHLLADVAKSDVIDQLEPLTRIYYEGFRRCPGCGQVYWPGSHFDKLRTRVDEIRALLRSSPS